MKNYLIRPLNLKDINVLVHRYSQVRLWGSVGFIVAAVGMGFWSETGASGIVPGLLLGLFVAVVQQPAGAGSVGGADGPHASPPLGQPGQPTALLQNTWKPGSARNNKPHWSDRPVIAPRCHRYQPRQPPRLLPPLPPRLRLRRRRRHSRPQQ